MPAKKWPSTYSFWPAIFVDGIEEVWFSQNLLSLKAAEDSTGQYCEATLNNWGAVGGSLGYLFSTSAAFDVGKPFAVKAQNTLLFTGVISVVTEWFPQGGPPQFTLAAKDMSLERLKTHDPQAASLKLSPRRRRNTWTLDLLHSAREWQVSLAANTDPPAGLVGFKRTDLSGHVIAEWNALLRIKDQVSLTGAGAKFLGDYSVTSVTQRWDHQNSAWTEFTIARPS